MASDSVTVQVEGLRELQRAISQVTRDLPKAADTAATNVARDWIARAQRTAGRPQQARAAQSLRVDPAGEGAAIRSSLEWFYGAEFGGGSRARTRQFPTFQGGRGYFLYPAEDEAKSLSLLGEAIDDITKPLDHKGTV